MAPADGWRHSRSFMANLPKAKRRAFDAKRYERRKAKAIAILGGACVKCGSRSGLEFDHIDPETKSFVITKRLSGGKWDLILKELAKCQLLCFKCHDEKSIVDLGKQDARSVHGTLSSYRYCKCDLCKAAWNKHSAEYRRKRRSEQRAGVAQR